MSAILVPVDFGLPCHNAYRFGLHLAEVFSLDVVLTHYSSGAIDPAQPLVFAGDGSLHSSQIERLRNFASSTAEGIDYPLLEAPEGVNISYETEVVFSVSAAIISRAKEDDIVAVVMAPRSSKKILGKWLGSTSTTVSESCNRPVYIVPNGVLYRPFKNIVVANNSVTAETFPLWQLDGMAKLFEAHLHFVHVEWPQQEGTLRFVPWRLMNKLVVDSPPATYPFDVVTVQNEDITRGLIDYTDQVDADLLVVVNKVRSRWRSLLHASLTQDLALNANRPLLVLHTDDPATGEKILQA